jgi:hypothetical protein
MGKEKIYPEAELAKSMKWDRAEVGEDDGDVFLVYIQKDPHYIDLKALISWIKKYKPELLE